MATDLYKIDRYYQNQVNKLCNPWIARTTKEN